MSGKLAAVPSLAIPDPPRPLGADGQSLWRRVQAEYLVTDAGGAEMLAQACAALDRAEACRRAIDRDGEMIATANGGVRDNPLLKSELANRAFCLRALAKLGLDVEPVRPIGRPPGS